MCKNCIHFKTFSDLEKSVFNCIVFRLVGICNNKYSDHHEHILNSNHQMCNNFENKDRSPIEQSVLESLASKMDDINV